MGKPSEHENAFVGYLESVVGAGEPGETRPRTPQQRAAAATLRRGLGKPAGTVAETYPFVEPWLSSEMPKPERDRFYTIAALLAWHPLCRRDADEPANPSNLGWSFSRLVETREDERRAEPSVERRFVALLNTHRDDLPKALRQAIGLLRSKGVPVNWAQLLADVREWGSDSHYAQRRWARAFWATGSQGTRQDREAEKDVG